MNKLFLCIIFLLTTVLSGNKTWAFEATQPECLAAAKLGGGFELTCRLAANSLLAANLIDTPMAITFKPGGIGAVAYNHVIGVRNNDPQLIVAASSGSALNIATKKFGSYDANAVRWLGALGADYGVIAVRNNAPWYSLDELIKSLVENQKNIIFGGGGSVGSQDWMKTALVVTAAGIDPKSIRYVAFEGGGEAATALMNGYIQVLPGDAAELSSLFEAGEVRILAVLGKERLPGNFAVVPTAREQGYAVDWTIWRGYYMGPEVSDEAYNWWVNTFRRLIKTDEFQQERQRLGLYPFALFGQQFDDFVQTSVKEHRQIAIDIGLIK